MRSISDSQVAGANYKTYYQNPFYNHDPELIYKKI